jgi:hypothetical protein
MGLQRVEAALEHIGAHAFGDLVGLLRRRIEGGRPFGKGAVAVGHFAQRECRLVIADRLRGFDDRVADGMVGVGKGEQLLAHRGTGDDLEIPDAADFVGGTPVLDLARDHARMPGRQAIEITDARPNLLDRRVDDGRNRNARHGLASLS